MFASLAISIAALRRMFALGSPPPFLAATVISRRIFEKSLPRWTSALPFLRLICDHLECPDIALPSFVRECRLESFHALEPQLTSGHRLPPAPPLPRRLWGERRAPPRPQRHRARGGAGARRWPDVRSEEHTSALQSHND